MNLESQTSQSNAAKALLAAAADAPLRIRGCDCIKAFRSDYLPDDRDVIVYLPPGYDEEPERTYPVLYLHDGQNLFDGRTSFVKGRTWQVREQADAGHRGRRS